MNEQEKNIAKLKKANFRHMGLHTLWGIFASICFGEIYGFSFWNWLAVSVLFVFCIAFHAKMEGVKIDKYTDEEINE